MGEEEEGEYIDVPLRRVENEQKEMGRYVNLYIRGTLYRN